MFENFSSKSKYNENSGESSREKVEGRNGGVGKSVLIIILLFPIFNIIFFKEFF